MTRLDTSEIPACPDCGHDILVDSYNQPCHEWVCYDCGEPFRTADVSVGVMYND